MRFVLLQVTIMLVQDYNIVNGAVCLLRWWKNVSLESNADTSIQKLIMPYIKKKKKKSLQNYLLFFVVVAFCFGSYLLTLSILDISNISSNYWGIKRTLYMHMTSFPHWYSCLPSLPQLQQGGRLLGWVVPHPQ